MTETLVGDARYSGAMSQENVEIVEASYEAFARGGLDRYMEHFLSLIHI